MGYKSKEDQREFQLRWVQGRRRTWLEANGPCVICGSGRNLRPFSYKVEIPHNIWSWSNKRQQPILQQCIALCASHHRIESLKRRHEQQNLATVTPIANANSIVVQNGKQIVITITIDVTQ